MKTNRTKHLFSSGKSACGSWVSLASAVGADVMGHAGFDWLLIDMEHGSGDLQTLLVQVLAITSAGQSTPIVRVQSNDPVVIKRVLDVGAEGIMVPGIKTADEARKAVASTLYPPHGIRSVAAPRTSGYGMDPAFLREANQNVAVFLQIETAAAVENIEDILDVPGIDVVFIGPNDLAADLGYLGQTEHPVVQAAFAKIEDAANRRGLALGSVTRSWEAAEKLLNRGYRAVSLMSDTSFILTNARMGIAKIYAHSTYATVTTSV